MDGMLNQGINKHVYIRYKGKILLVREEDQNKMINKFEFPGVLFSEFSFSIKLKYSIGLNKGQDTDLILKKILS